MVMGIHSGGGRSLPFADVRGKVAVLTVSTDGGPSLAREFVKRGCRVVLLGSPLARLEEACSRVCQPDCTEQRVYDPACVRAVALDATRGEKAVERAVEEAWCAFGVINILVNSASVSGTIRPVLEMSENEYDEIMTVNVKASWLVSKAVARKMQKAGTGGSIMFLTSISGTERGICPGVSIYGTSMAAINHLTKLMALELGKYAIRVNAISRGLTGFSHLLESKGKDSLEKLAKRVVPLQRWSQFPNDIIGVILWLAGDSSSFVTGTTTIVDGGVSLRRPRMREYRSRL